MGWPPWPGSSRFILCGLATLTGFLQVNPMWAGHPDRVPPGKRHYPMVFLLHCQYQKYQKLLQPEKYKLKIQSKRVLGCTKIHTLTSKDRWLYLFFSGRNRQNRAPNRQIVDQKPCSRKNQTLTQHNKTTGKKVPPAHAKRVYLFLRQWVCESVSLWGLREGWSKRVLIRKWKRFLF